MAMLTTSGFAPLLLTILLHLTLSPATEAELQMRAVSCNTTDGNYTTTSAYKTNLESLFSKTTNKNHHSGFYNFSAGHSSDKASLISLCLDKVNVSGCHECQSFVIHNLKSSCPNEKTAIAWSDDCFVRYSKRSIMGKLEESPGFYMIRGTKAADDVLEEFTGLVKTLLQGLPGNASAGGSRAKFASAQADLNSSVTIYAAAQCTPDLKHKECFKCLDHASNVIQTCDDCKGQRGARILFPSCMVRFEDYKFYVSSDAPAPRKSPSLAPAPSTSPSPSVGPGPSMSPSPSPSLGPGPSMSPSPSPESYPGTSPSPSVGPRPSTSPTSPSSAPAPNMSPSLAPSDNSSVNGAKERFGSRSSIVAIALVGACCSALL